MSVNSALATIAEQLGFHTEDVSEQIERMPGLSLTAPDQIQALLARVSRSMQADKPTIAASQFIKWYCRSLVAVLYEFSVLGIARSSTLRDVTVLFPGDPPFAVHCAVRTVQVTEATREHLRELTVIRLFAHNWNLVIKNMHEHTGIREDLLWENGAVYLHFYYRQWIENAEKPSDRQRIEEDYQYVIQQAPPELFGELQCFNPFQWTGKPVRNTCCLRCHLPEGRYCKGCPKQHTKS